MLFDKNGFYLPENSYKDDYDFAVSILDGSYDNKFKIYDLAEAFKKRNLFPGLYAPYKKFGESEPKVSGSREKALYEIQKLDFSINDLNLYLDIYPHDVYAYHIFKKYVQECKKKKEEYTKIYGPLMLEDLTDEYEWSKSVWPWEEGRM